MATLDLEKMTTEEKMRIMELIWDDLSHQAAEMPSPGWHAAVLEQREQNIREGKDEFQDWSDVKQEIRKLTS